MIGNEQEVFLKKVEAFANNAHGSQKRKFSAEPYIVHPVRVMETCKRYTSDITVLAAALLHDVLEDTPTTKDQISKFLQSLMSDQDVEKTISLVVELTDVFMTENYRNWNRQKRKEHEADRLSRTSAQAQTIKYADIIDNTDITVTDPDFARVYLRECKNLLEKMADGDPELRKKAMDRVETCIELSRSQPAASFKNLL